ncbi:MAG: methylmalonyl-CoA epimerase [Planctomycetes bacterium]|nr:methylmalonyl-CoA epimerase [Planctomycetota bacterium]
MSELILDHIAIAVADLDAALEFWRDRLGMPLGPIDIPPGLGARVAFLDTGPTATELVEPHGEDSPVARFLASGKRGVHHIAYRVKDIDAELARLRAAKVPLIHERAVPGSRGTRVAFIHPRSTDGVLVELVEYPPAVGNRLHGNG